MHLGVRDDLESQQGVAEVVLKAGGDRRMSKGPTKISDASLRTHDMPPRSSTKQHASRTCARRPRRTRSAQTRPRSRKVLLTARSFVLEPARESHKAQSQAHCSKKESHAKMSAVMSMRKQSKLPVLHLQATPSAAQKREGIERAWYPTQALSGCRSGQ